jgi:two-component system CheB/CheR fusion protein
MVAIDDTEGLDPAGAGWYHAHARSVRSELVVPVPDEGFPAVLGVTRTVASPWSEDERRLLATVAQMIGAARTKERARRGLVELVASKDRFIASVSHELRTPMAVVMGLSSELTDRRSQFGETEVAEFIDLIARQSREVAHIIEDLLVAARASAASITVLPEVIRLDREVEAALNSLPSEHTWRLAAVELAPVTTLADPLRIRQIIRNLVSNGHRHGRGGVRVTVHAVEGRAALDVSDDGPPIAPDRQAEMFEAYTASGQSGTPASIGLGLTVSRQLARLMGGDVTYLATPVSTFRLTLPVAEMAADTTIAAPIDALST